MNRLILLSLFLSTAGGFLCGQTVYRAAKIQTTPTKFFQPGEILVEKGKRSRRVLGPDHPLTVEVLGQLEQALSPTSPFSPTSPSSLAPAPAPPLTVDDV